MSNQTDNPVAQSIAHLHECGWTKEQAEHLVGAVQADSAEQLWTIAPKWIEHCSESIRYVRDMLGLVAMGLMTVTMGDDGQWRFQLNDRGIEAGHQMGLPAREFGAMEGGR